MSRVIYSPLVSDLRNKIGDLVFSCWKGRGYVRRRVIPANPKSVDQVAQRTAFALCVAIWKALSSLNKTSFADEAQSAAVSGFNRFMTHNVKQERTDDGLVTSGDNADVEHPDSVSVDTGAAEGEIDITWAEGDAEGTDDIRIIHRDPETSELTIDDPAAVTISDETYTLGGLVPEQEYVVTMCARNTTNGLSLADGGKAAACAAA